MVVVRKLGRKVAAQERSAVSKLSRDGKRADWLTPQGQGPGIEVRSTLYLMAKPLSFYYLDATAHTSRCLVSSVFWMNS